WMIALDHCRFCTGDYFDVESDRRRHDPLDVAAKSGGDLVGVLIGSQAKADFCRCPRRDDRFHSRSLITADNSVDSQGRPDRRSFIECEALLSPSTFYLRVFEDLSIARTHALHVRTFLLAPVANVVVKLWNCNASVVVMQFRDHVRENLQGIVNRAAEVSGV